MTSNIDHDDVRAELVEIQHLLFFLGESLGKIQDGTLACSKGEVGSASFLVYETNRHIDKLVTLQAMLIDKVESVKILF